MHLLITVTWLLFGLHAHAAPSVRLVKAFPKLVFERPVFLTYSPGAPSDKDARLFVVEQDGKIRVFENQPEAKVAPVFLDLSKKVSRGHSEEGLLGLAFDPDFAKNGFFYVNYTAERPLRTVIERYRVSGDPKRARVADPKSVKLILEINQPYRNHNGGMIAFGPDGYFYIGMGDGGAGGDPKRNGQSLSTLLGKILRLDVRDKKAYRIPKDNPFVGRKNARPEIWAYGLRNPWRFSFDRKDKTLWCADVGQNAFEEISLITRGDNLGWNLCEGFHPFPEQEGLCKADAVLPIHEYGRRDGISVTGGYVYRGKRVSVLDGVYVYGDFGTATVWGIRHDAKKKRTRNERLLTSPEPISSFGEDPNGELYVVGYGGTIYRFNVP